MKKLEIWACGLLLLGSLPLTSLSAQSLSNQGSRFQAGLGPDGFIQAREAPEREEFDRHKGLSLNMAIEQGLRLNYLERGRDLLDQKKELEWQDIFTEYWYPELNIKLSTYAHGLGTLRSGSRAGQVGTSSPSGEISLGFEDYTLFNWGRDYMRFLNQREQNHRERERISEETRELKHKIIITYANLLTTTQIEQIKRDQLRHTSYIYNLNREKVMAQTVSRQDYYQSRSEYLRAQTEFYQARVHRQRASEMMAEILADPASTHYSIQESIRFRSLNLGLEEAKNLARQASPSVLDASTDLKIATRGHDLARRENLPLPTISMNLGAYRHGFGEGRNNSTRYETYPGSSDIEVVASLNATWPLLGRGGPLNSRRLQQSYLDKRISQVNWQNSQHEIFSQIQQYIYSIDHLETQIEILEARNTSLKRTFDTVLQNYINGNSSFQDFRQVLIEKIEARELRAVSLFQHLRDKVELASTIGIEDFPGENFEDLINR